MKKLIIALVFLLLQNVSYSQWFEQLTPGPTFNLFSSSFPSVNTGFAVGYGNRMIKTSNGGNNWFNISIFPNTAHDLNSVFFINENSGWMCSTNDTLYHTTNSAVSWTAQMKLYSQGQKIFFIDSNTGWILAQPKLYRTTDSGQSWSIINSQMDQYLTFLNSNTGWTTTYSGGSSTIKKTTDGGFTWTPQYSTSNFRAIYCINFINENTGWAAGYREHILKTTNGGVNWSQQRDMNNSVGFFDIKFVNENTGWVTGDGSYAYNTINGGNTWNQVSMPAGRSKIHFVNSNIGWIVGSKVFKTSSLGFIFKTLQMNVLIEGFYDQESDDMVNDIATVYLKNAVSPYNTIDSISSNINSKGAGEFNFLNAVNGTNYFIAVKHRNSIETWSSTAVSFVNNSLNYDLTVSSNQAFGNNLKQVNNSPLKFALYSGDVNQDGIIDGDDLSLVENDVSISISGYVTTDLTGDNFVDGSDQSIVENNVSSGISVIRP
jgi:photosystem II stability/assembly factor-like uncharacterized protein